MKALVIYFILTSQKIDLEILKELLGLAWLYQLSKEQNKNAPT
jgi:hypothetical protein